MKKTVSFIILTAIFMFFLPVYAVNNVNRVDMPASDGELGFIFTTDGKNNMTSPDEYSGIVPISEELNIYYAADAETLNTVADKFNIIDWEEDFKIEVPDEEIDLNGKLYTDIVSLFSDENINDTADEETQYPNDPLLERQWYYEAVKGYAFRNNDITGKGVKVGIIDTGLTKEFKTFHDFDGVDIQTGINVAAYIEQTRPGHEHEDRIYCTEDSQTHGTSVASVICSKINNEHGIAGLVDGCTIIPYKIEDYYYADDNTWLKGSALMRAIELAYQDNCDVVNISWGGAEKNVSTALNRIVDNCIKNGMIILAAVGNSGEKDNPIEYPAACDNVIGVGGVRPDCEPEDICIDAKTEKIKPENEATLNDKFTSNYILNTVQGLADNQYVKTESSTANESVFVCAPGLNILTADSREISKKLFLNAAGTSFATPIVASAAIGVKQMRPYIDVDMFKEIIKVTSTDLEDEGYDINTGWGMVNFERIYDYVSQMPLTAPERTTEVSIDYENEKLVGFPINRMYTVNGENIPISEDGTLPINEEWFGNTISIVKKASSESYEDSEPQEIDIPARASAPIIELISDNTVNIASNIIYKEENSDEWKESDSNNTITLEQGKTYFFKVQHTENSFASEVRQITVQFAPTEQYEIETSIVYDHDSRECIYSAVNNTIWTINAKGIIAVYDQNGGLKHLETIDTFPADGINKKLNFALSDGDTVKFIVWDSLQLMKPRDKVKRSEYTVDLTLQLN